MTTSPTSNPPATPESWGEARERTVQWWDPMAGAAQGLAMPGIDYLQAMADGVLPPPPIPPPAPWSRPAARVGFTEGVVTDEAGNAVATATSTLLIFDLPAA